MNDGGHPTGACPGPPASGSVHDFVTRLGTVKIWAGDPSFERLARRAGVPRSTLADALNVNRSRPPALDVVRRFVRSCGADDRVVSAWEAAWRQLDRPSRTASPATRPGGEPARSGPALLPADVADFVGRDKQVAELVGKFRAADDRFDPTAPVVAVVTGRGGVGKTALAVRVAHRLVGDFPDGQLYVNLRDADGGFADPTRVLGRFLRVLGLDGSVIPTGLEERAELFRTVLADRRMLVVLDNAGSAAQIRPLLPGSPSCGVLVTSRARLAELPGAYRLYLDVLELEEAVALLAAVVGAERTTAEPDAAQEIVRLCGHLPLAVRIAAARLANRPHRPLAWLANRLADRRRLLNELAIGDLDVRGSLALSYQALPAEAARAIRLLAWLDAPDFAAWIAAPLLDVELDDAEELVDSLADAYLLDPVGTDATGRVRYRLHDLVRLYARERSEATDPEPERQAALTRAFGAWLAVAERAEARLPSRERPPMPGDAIRCPPPPDELAQLTAEPLVWFDAERGNLVAGIEQAFTLGRYEHGVELTCAIGNYLDIAGHYDDAERLYRLAVDQSREHGDRRGEAAALLGLVVLWTNGPEPDPDQAMAAATRAVELFDQLGDLAGRVKALEGVSYLHHRGGRVDEALRCAEAALALPDPAHPDVRGSLWLTHGFAHFARGDYAAAEESYAHALELARARGLRVTEALALRALGSVQRRHGEHRAAERNLRSALAIMDELDYPSARAAVLLTLGQLQADMGLPEARSTLDRALAACRRLGVGYGQGLALATLGELHCADGRPDQAVHVCQTALDVLGDLDEPLLRATVLRTLGTARRALGEHRAAVEAWRAARELHLRLGNTAEAEEVAALLRSASE